MQDRGAWHQPFGDARTVISIIQRLTACRAGASAAEYCLIVAVLGGFTVAGTTLFGQSLMTMYEFLNRLLAEVPRQG